MITQETYGRIRSISTCQRTFDLNGHFHGHQREIQKKFKENNNFLMLMTSNSTASIAKLEKAINTGKLPKSPIRIGPSLYMTCPHCGEDVSFVYTNENGENKFTATPCPYPKGMPAFTAEINIPSGRFAVANDLRNNFPLVGDFDISHTNGIKLTFEAYSKLGLGHGFVGNTCPGFFSQGKEKFYIATGHPIKKSKEEASICTDLWWYSICDYNELLKQKPKIGKLNQVEIVDAKPGVYLLEHRYHLCNRKKPGKKGDVYASLTWLRDPDPIQELQKEERKKNHTAEQIVADALNRYGKNLKSDDKAIRAKANHIMCVIGNGYDYHPNGWLGSNPAMQTGAPSIKIPRFKGKYSWYPLSHYSAICCGAGLGENTEEDYHFNRSFAELAFNIVTNMLTDGSTKEDDINQQEWAWKIYLGLKKRYPKWIPRYAQNLPNPKKNQTKTMRTRQKLTLKRKKNGGYTLPELLLVIWIIAIGGFAVAWAQFVGSHSNLFEIPIELNFTRSEHIAKVNNYTKNLNLAAISLKQAYGLVPGDELTVEEILASETVVPQGALNNPTLVTTSKDGATYQSIVQTEERVPQLGKPYATFSIAKEYGSLQH